MEPHIGCLHHKGIFVIYFSGHDSFRELNSLNLEARVSKYTMSENPRLDTSAL